MLSACSIVDSSVDLAKKSVTSTSQVATAAFNATGKLASATGSTASSIASVTRSVSNVVTDQVVPNRAHEAEGGTNEKVVKEIVKSVLSIF